MKMKAILVMMLFGMAGWAQMRIIPHVTPVGGDFATSFILANTMPIEQEIRLMPFTANGEVLQVVTLTLAPDETRFLTTSELFPEGGVSHFIVTSDSEIALTAAYQDAAGANSPAHLGLADTQAVRWRIYPGTLNDVVDGLAVVNVDDLTRDIHVRQLDQQGTELDRVTIFRLGPKSKGLYLFGDFERRGDAYFEVFSEGPLALTALRFSSGDTNARYFWQTAAVPLPALVESSNQQPVITGQAELTTSGQTPLTITLADLTVVDEDNTYPDDFSLTLQPGSNYTLEGNTMTASQGFAGLLQVPVTVNDGELDSEPYTLQITVTAPQDPRIGTVATLRNNPTYGITGRAVIADERTVRLEEFNYNGSGPDVRVYLVLDEDYANGIIISNAINGSVYQNQTLDFTLPDGVTLDDFNGISIWCFQFSVSFSEGTFQ